MTEFHYPGFDLDLRHLKNEHYPVGFPEAKGSQSDTLHMREVAMMMLMDQITDKPNWNEKVFDEEIVSKWRHEAATQSEESLFLRILEDKDERLLTPRPRKIITEQAFDYASLCIAELRLKAKYFAEKGLVPTLDSASYCAVKSDKLLSEELRIELTEAFDTLRADQAADVDWHPRSGDMVQDLVHPSMYPFVYGQTHFIKEEKVGIDNTAEMIGQGAAIAERYKDPADKPRLGVFGVGSGRVAPNFWSEKYQWLPANVAFENESRVYFTSYINNLHPGKYQQVYKTIEKAISAAVPFWDQCLAEYHRYKRQTSAGRSRSRFEQIVEANDEDLELWSEFDLDYYSTLDMPISEDDQEEIDSGINYFDNFIPALEKRRALQGEQAVISDDAYIELLHDEEALVEEKRAYFRWSKHRQALLPEPLPFVAVNYEPEESIRDINAQDGLQVIVKMASIELTPDKPEFPAGSWHIEGMMNEKICATALFYLDSGNVTDSHIAFRAQTSAYLSDDISTGQDQYDWLERVFGTGLGYGSECWQAYGDVKTPQGRILAFPNTLQHRVSPFKLQDPTKPGHRRFLALWLVDPHVRIISTANVPPQQSDWCEAEKLAFPPAGVMSREQAREHRLALMDERSAGHRKLESDWRTTSYHFCEH